MPENRGWVARLVSNETNTVTTLSNIEIKDPLLKVAIPLYSVSHASGRDLGNTWTTNFTASDVESPLFRIGPNTEITMHLSAKVSSDLKSQGASMVVGAVTQAVKIAAPSATILTTLSKAEVGNAAQAIDTAISGLFSQEITEDIDLGRLADSWNPDAYLTLTGCAPYIATDAKLTAPQPGCASTVDFDQQLNIRVGTWTVRLRCPRPSAFVARDVCHTIGNLGPVAGIIPLNQLNLRAIHRSLAAEASDTQILQFSLSSQINIQGFVQTQDWYTNFVKLDKSKIVRDDYASFCSNALGSLVGSGLNKLDAALALRAMIRRMPGVLSQRNDFATNPKGADCRTLLQDADVAI